MGRQRWVTGGLLGTFAALRVFSSAGVPVRFPDTVTYLPLNFVGDAGRLWTVPLVWNLADTDWLRVTVQVALGVTAWSILAVSVGRSVSNRPLRWMAMTAVLIVGLSPQVTQWDRALLSESLATSLLVLLIALLLRASISRGPRIIAGMLAVGTLWIFTRQLNALLFLCLLPVLLGYVLWRLRGRARVTVAAALVVIGAWSGVALTADTRASRSVEAWNSVQIIENRIAVQPAALAFFQTRGMPPSPYVQSERGTFPGQASPLFTDRVFMRWVNTRFQSVYAAYLLSRWPSTFTEPFARVLPAISDPTTFTTPRSVLPSQLLRPLWHSQGAIILWALLAAACLALAVVTRTRVRGRPLILLLVLFSAAGTVLTWNLTGYGPGDTTLARLFLPVAVSVRLAIVLALALSLDALLCRDAEELDRHATGGSTSPSGRTGRETDRQKERASTVLPHIA